MPFAKSRALLTVLSVSALLASWWLLRATRRQQSRRQVRLGTAEVPKVGSLSTSLVQGHATSLNGAMHCLSGLENSATLE